MKQSFRQLTFAVAFTLSILLVHDSLQAGTISGTVKVRGLRSPENIVVYLTNVPEQPASPSGRIVMDQKRLSFLPHVLVIPVGATVHFPNNDEVDHNVFSLSRTRKFNLGSYGPGESKSVVFDKPGLVELRCDMHAEMSAYILVMKNRYFGITDSKGRFAIPDNDYLEKTAIGKAADLPPGKYIIRTWHEKLKSGKKTIEIPATGNAVIELQLKRGTPGALFKR